MARTWFYPPVFRVAGPPGLEPLNVRPSRPWDPTAPLEELKKLLVEQNWEARSSVRAIQLEGQVPKEDWSSLAACLQDHLHKS